MRLLLKSSPPAPRPTYDERQISARLVKCQSCGKQWFMTVVQQPCIECRG